MQKTYVKVHWSTRVTNTLKTLDSSKHIIIYWLNQPFFTSTSFSGKEWTLQLQPFLGSHDPLLVSMTRCHHITQLRVKLLTNLQRAEFECSSITLTFEVKNQGEGFVVRFILYMFRIYFRLALSRGLWELRGYYDIWMFMVSIWVFPKIGVQYPKMDGLWWKTLLKWMICGYHYFWKHPYVSWCFMVSLYSEYGTSTDPPEPHIAATLQLGSPGISGTLLSQTILHPSLDWKNEVVIWVLNQK